MDLNTLKQFNWVDIFIVLLFVRICFVAAKTGIAAEFFKILGTLVGLYLSLHYYTFVSDWFIKSILSLEDKVPLAFLDFVFFVLLAVAGYVVFALVRTAFDRLIKMQAVASLNKWGGFFLGIGRGILLVGMVVFTLAISSISYLRLSAQRSYLGARAFEIAPATYRWMWDVLASKFFPGEKFNDTVREVQESFQKQ